MKSISFFTILLLLFGTFSLNAQNLSLTKGKNGKWGYNLIRKVVVKPKYEEAERVLDGMAAVKLNGKWGYINDWGREVIPHQYDSAASFNQGKAQVTMNGETFYIDKKGNRIDPNAPVVDNSSLLKKTTTSSIPIKTSLAPETIPISIDRDKGKTEIKLGDRKFTVIQRDEVEGTSGYLKVTGDFERLSITSLAKKQRQDQFYFDFKKGELTASFVVHVPGLGLAGLVSSDAKDNISVKGRVAWLIFEDNGRVRFPGYDDFIVLHNLHDNRVTADKILYIGVFKNGDYTSQKFSKLNEISPGTNSYAILYENGKRTHLWGDVQDLLVHADNYARKRRNLCLRIGENGSVMFVNRKDERLTAYVLDSTLSQITAHDNAQMVATNDGSSATAFTLHSPQNQGKDPMFGKQFGPWSNIFYSILLPSENEGYYSVLDENGIAYKPDNSYGLLPFITSHGHIKRGFKAQHRINKDQNGFEVLHFFMAAIQKDSNVVWQPVNHFGKPYPSQKDKYFLNWEMVNSRYLEKINAINALPYFLLANTIDNKWQAFFPSRYGITHLPEDVFEQYSGTIAPLTDEMPTAEEAYVQAEVQIQIIQQTHLEKRSEAYAIQKAQSDRMWEEYRRQHAGKSNNKIDWSGWTGMTDEMRSNLYKGSSSWGQKSEVQKLKEMRYYMGKAPSY